MTRTERIISVSLALSASAHALVIMPAPAMMPPTATARVPSFVEFSFEAPGSKEPDARASPEPTATLEMAAVRQPRPRRLKEAGRALPVGANGPELAAIMPEDRARDAPTSIASAPKVLNLMPRSSSLVITPCGISDDRKTDCVATNKDASGESIERGLNESLSVAANRPAYRSQRPPPKLLAAADGGYDYSARTDSGSVLLFRAHIAKDGAVRFEDGPNLQIAPIPIAGTFDFSDALQPGERHAAEKRWFLEQTAELRERLTNAARAREDRRMRRIVADDAPTR